jgi:hypothetical protein
MLILRRSMFNPAHLFVRFSVDVAFRKSFMSILRADGDSTGTEISAFERLDACLGDLHS